MESLPKAEILDFHRSELKGAAETLQLGPQGFSVTTPDSFIWAQRRGRAECR